MEFYFLGDPYMCYNKIPALLSNIDQTNKELVKIAYLNKEIQDDNGDKHLSKR
jgi:hypothetical protein